MCFTPWVSLATGIIEFAVATFILIRYKNYLVPVFSAIFIYVLGFYQFMEFLLCITPYSRLWAALGFATYTFLPAMGLHISLRFTGVKFKNWILYILPISFAAIALLRDGFVLGADCEKIFILTNFLFPSFFSLGNLFLIPTIIYDLYYFGFIICAEIILIKHFKDKSMSKIFQWIAGIGFLSLAAPIFLVFIVPSLLWRFPSVYCEFSLLFTIAAVISSKIYDKKKKKEKFIK